MKTVAIITARGGSKGFPGKNIAPLRGRPLISYTIEAAQKSGVCDGCFVSTDDPEIKRISLSYGSRVIDRPADLSTDAARSQDAVAHALRQIAAQEGTMPEYFMLLQPTVPLRGAEDVSKCFKQLVASEAQSIMSVTPVQHHPRKMLIVEGDHLNPLFTVADLSTPRQELPEVFMQNGAMYALRSEIFLREMSFFVPPTIAYIMPPEVSIDIDCKSDLDQCERYLQSVSLT